MKGNVFISTALIALYLGVIGGQPMHVYLEHFGEPDCHGECHGSCSTEPSGDGIKAIEDVCPVCAFHFAVVQGTETIFAPPPGDKPLHIQAENLILPPSLRIAEAVQRGPPHYTFPAA